MNPNRPRFSLPAAVAMSLALHSAMPMAPTAPEAPPSFKATGPRPTYGRGHKGSKKPIDVAARRAKNRAARAARKRSRRQA